MLDLARRSQTTAHRSTPLTQYERHHSKHDHCCTAASSLGIHVQVCRSCCTCERMLPAGCLSRLICRCNQSPAYSRRCQKQICRAKADAGDQVPLGLRNRSPVDLQLSKISFSKLERASICRPFPSAGATLLWPDWVPCFCCRQDLHTQVFWVEVTRTRSTQLTP